ncbi:hypothetical protein N5P37_004826 [Trichoderma harzianum]|nr:hypothetical protein N5P37_004826 [Trichoderma harzianum]
MSGVSEPGVPLNRSYGHHSNSASSTSNNTTETECQAVTDPRAIKRLQNRVAQRSYRRRVKLRLAELQERIARYEGTAQVMEGEVIENSSKSPPDVSILSKVQSAASNLPSCASSSNHPNTDAQVLSPINLSLNKRFQSIMECVGAMGFESFDELVTSYYVDEFEEASQLFHEQRFSRHRRLPVVFADILEGARRWKPSERRGLGEEVLKEAEAVLIAEISQAWKALQPLTDTGAFEQDCQQTPQNTTTHADRLRQHLRTVISTEYYARQRLSTELVPTPILWTLLMALVASDGPAWQRDCSGTALAIIALLHLAGRLPKETLLELIGSCL